MIHDVTSCLVRDRIDLGEAEIETVMTVKTNIYSIRNILVVIKHTQENVMRHNVTCMIITKEPRQYRLYVKVLKVLKIFMLKDVHFDQAE